MHNPFSKIDAELGLKEDAEEKAIQEENQEMQKLFRKVFSVGDGKKVLNVILNDLKFFDRCNNERDLALRNYATTLLIERMGYVDTVSMTENILNSKHE